MDQARRENADVAVLGLWCEALWRFGRAPHLAGQRERQVEVIGAIKHYLEPMGSVEQLTSHFRSSAEVCRRVILALHPGDPQLQDLRRTRDVAYALRYVEIMTGHRLEPGDALPSWIGEWGVF